MYSCISYYSRSTITYWYVEYRGTCVPVLVRGVRRVLGGWKEWFRNRIGSWWFRLYYQILILYFIYF